jgi:type IV pilus biogenesis protein PilP
MLQENSMRNDIIQRLVAVLIAFGPALGMAEPTVGDLSKIQGETLIIKAKANREAAQAELDARTRATGGYSGSDESNVPVVKSVYGVRDTLVATFIYPNGTTMEAKVGDTLNGGFKVTKIAVDRVELMRNKKVIQVGFSATPPVATVPGPGPGLGPGMPQLTAVGR